MLTRATRFFNTNGFKYVLVLTIAAIFGGTLGIMYFENMELGDALWWAFVTVTTVGYGDLSPASNAGRIIASVLMLVGIGLIGSLTSSITSFFLREDREKEEKFSTDKVEMVLHMYHALSGPEQEAVRNEVNREATRK